MRQPLGYRVALAKQIIERIREGETLTQICRDKKKRMPNRRLVYDWLRNPNCKIGKDTFESAYWRACQDRGMTWQDEAMELHDAVQVTGTRTDHTELKRAESKANLLIRMAKEQRESLKAAGSGPGGGSDVNVTIRTFGKLAKADES